jgi:enoyl-CoA hydratase/carnithine racemase
LVRESKPIIAAVNGAAVGIGVTMILPFDIIISSDKARFGLVFIKMGIVPELASTHFLVSRVGWGRASEMMLSGKLYSGEEVHNYGLSEHLVGGEALLEKAFEIANLMAENPDKQLRMTKQLLTTNAVTTDLKAAEMLETKLLQVCWETEEHKEAVSAAFKSVVTAFVVKSCLVILNCLSGFSAIRLAISKAFSNSASPPTRCSDKP